VRGEQIQADATQSLQAKADTVIALLQAQSVAHKKGLEQGAGIGVGAFLVLFALIFGVKNLASGFTVARKRARRD
jgi:hypothetical protein